MELMFFAVRTVAISDMAPDRHPSIITDGQTKEELFEIRSMIFAVAIGDQRTLFFTVVVAVDLEAGSVGMEPGEIDQVFADRLADDRAVESV